MRPHHGSLVALALLLCTSFSPLVASAVLPPDVIFSVGSQLTQVFAAVVVFVTGSLVAVLPFVRGFFSGARARAILLVLGGILLALGAGIYLARNIHRTPTAPTGTGTAESATSSRHHFFSDRFVLAGERKDKSMILIDLIINRKEREEGGFTHYYLLNLIDGTSSGKFMEQREMKDPAILPNLILDGFLRAVAPDHSSRESFSLSFNRAGKHYEVTTSVFSADFITKNEPEYTLYASAGTSSVTVGDEIIPLHAYYERVYSEDYRPTIFFDGSETLPSRTTQLILWDDAGNFYLVDRSEVLAYSPSYAPHFWALMKDGDGFTKKAYTGLLSTTRADGLAVTGSVPDLNDVSFRVKLMRQFNTDQTKGWAEGVVEDNSGVPRRVVGQCYVELYGGAKQ